MSGIFITNSKEGGQTLKERLGKLIGVSQELKFLVGFFYFSGSRELYEYLKNNESIKLKILVGLQVDNHLSKIIEIENLDKNLSNEEYFYYYLKSLGKAINNPEMDNEFFYEQIEFFIEMLKSSRLEIKKTLNPNHAKVYLFQYNKDYSENRNRKGEFITGSSNLTKAGLESQEEFNVEISDYGFERAEEYFDKLWNDAVPISQKEEYKKVIIDFLENRALSALVTPFEAYTLILKTYVELQDKKENDDLIKKLLKEAGFEEYKYQVDAVNQAINIIETYNGVIIADVVGLGKSVIASLIASKLGKRGLIICPPGLMGDERENTGWYGYKNDFKLYDWDIKSSGNVEDISKIIQNDKSGYEVIIIDEAHRFRNQDTSAYESLSNICRDKKVILLTATPFNNLPSDIYSLLKLFIVPGKSSITIDSDLEKIFSSHDGKFRQLSDIIKNKDSQLDKNRENAQKSYKNLVEHGEIDIKKIKEKLGIISNEIKNIISPVVIRRNRIDLKEDYEYKKEINNLSEVRNPQELFYDLDEQQIEFYDNIIKNYFGENGKFTGAIYKPFQYENQRKEELNEEENRVYQQQKNLYDFMRRLLVKRFESSFGAFEKSIERFLKVNEMVLSFVKKSDKYILDRKKIENIYSLEEEDFLMDEIEEMLIDFKKNINYKSKLKHTKVYDIKKFFYKEEFINDIESDIKLFRDIKEEIKSLNIIENDPKRRGVLSQIKSIIRKEPERKVILFTEYTDTVKHLEDYFRKELKDRVLFCDGNINKKFISELNSNFNAKNKEQKNDYDILVTSDKLSEGFNLNRAGAIINYDIPWNPTRVIQRLGRINRIGAKVFDELYIYNLFPGKQGADIVKSREIASQKMFLIHSALGEDSKILDDEESPSPSRLFQKINANPQDKEELNISTKIRNKYKEIKDNYPELLEKISKLPNRVKTAKVFNEDMVLVLRKKGRALFSFFGRKINDEIETKEGILEDLLNYSECDYNEIRKGLTKNFWDIYKNIDKNKRIYKNKNSTEKSLETQALNSLKSILKDKTDLNQEIKDFIDTLLRDIKDYKTLPKYTLRKLCLNGKDSREVIENIEELMKSIGNDYLKKIDSRNNIENDIVIAIQNIKTKS